ncbi:MAG: diguanylate cyclase [Bacteroidota bacterium]|nr:diguanylate cyclase [Bacteroidota bacterium]
MKIKEPNSLSQSYQKNEMMKKLIFDDFQHHDNGDFKIEEVSENSYKPLSETVSNTETEGLNTANQLFKMPSVEKLRVIPQFQVADFFDVNSEIFKGETEPRTEFDFLLTKVLGVIKEVLFAHTAAFFWANREKHQMIMESFVSDSPSFFTSRRFTMGHDLVSKVAEAGKPEFISEVNPLSEAELLHYYERPTLIKSFIGVPVFFVRGNIDESVEKPVGVLIVDSKATDDFGQETLTLLGQFTKLISALIKSYNDKYDLLLDSELLSSIRRLQERIKQNFRLPSIVQSLAEETSKLINWDYLSIVLYDEAKRAWVAKKITNRVYEGYIVTEQAIDFPESIVGQAIKNNLYTYVDDLNANTTPRYYSEEKLDRKGSFVSIPISSLNKCYGAVNIESRDKSNFSRRDIDMLYRLAENTAYALEIFFMQEMINEYVIIDDVTGMYSKKFFMQRIEEELQRSDDSGTELSLLFVTIDRTEEIVGRYGTESFERVMLTLSKAVRASVRSYDLVGRYDTNRFGILLINTAANEAYIWAEKIRKNIAGLVINIDGKNISITISVGVAGAMEGMKKEELVGNSVAVLNAASQAGGNVVRVF